MSSDQLLHKAGNSVFRLARMAMLRASEIHLGSPPLVEFTSTEKETTIALREIAQDRIILKKNVKENIE